MGAAFYGVDVVDVRVYVLVVVGVVHHGHLDGYALLLGLEVNHVVEEVGAVPVDVPHKLLQPVLGVEDLLPCLAFLVGAQVGQGDGYAGVEVCQLAHALGNDVVFEFGGGGEDGRVGPELLARAPLLGLAHYLDRVEGLALLILLLVYLAVAEHLREHLHRQGVDAAHAHSVQSAAHFV